jgi:hypothetical protein
VTVEDVYVIQDYVSWIHNSIDRDINLLHKEIHTQHQWRFEAVNTSFHFPFGVKTAYRAYSSKKVVEFRKVPKDQALHPVGQDTGLDPYTLYCTWQPEPYGINSQQNRNGIEGMYLLKTIPNGEIPIVEFVEKSQSYTTKFIRRIKSEYKEDLKPLIYREWDIWYTNIAPRLLPHPETAIDTVEETSVDYVRRLRSSPNPEIRKLVTFPLSSSDIFTNRDIKNTNIRWEISENMDEVFDKAFKWPEQLAAAMNSVESTLNLNPQAPRLIALSDQNLIDWRVSFITKTIPYFETILEGTKPKMVEKLNRLVSYTGESMSSANQGKSALANKMKQFSRSFFVTIFKPVNETFRALVRNITTRPLDVSEALRTANVFKSSYLEDVSMTYADIRDFGTTQDVTQKAYDAFLILLANRNERVCRSHRDVNAGTDGYAPRKKSIFFPSLFFNDIENLISDSADVCKLKDTNGEFQRGAYHRFFFTVQFSDFETGIIVLDLIEETFSVYSPHRDKSSDGDYLNRGFNDAIDNVVRYLENLTRGTLNCSQFSRNVLSSQYLKQNMTDLPAKFEILLSLYFLDVEVPLWYDSDQLSGFRINVCSYLLLGELPF